MDKRIPVTIITGFLGSGKTTLLNELIQRYPNKKLAIIENEFGELGIDQDLVVRGEDQIFELSNGCICCSLNDELVDTLAKLLNGNYEFDQLVIETTGIAEPDAIAAAFVADASVQAYFQLDAVICLADAQYTLDSLAEREEAKRQLAFADLILLNKKSSVSAEQLAETKAGLTKLNPLAEIIEADYGKTERNLLDLQAYAFATVEEKLKAQHQPKTCSHGSHHHHHHQQGELVTHSFIFDQPFDLLKLRHWLQVLLMLQGEGIYRVKGVLWVQWQDKKMVLQSVRKSFALQLGEDWPEGKPRQSRIVFIGKNLRKDILEKSLKQLLALETSF